MGYNAYICPDGKTCLIDDCLKKCRLGEGFEAGRCLSRRTLKRMAQQREWTGLPSTTQCISGTRCEYLKIKHTYAVNPQDLVFALFGTGVHSVLEQVELEGAVSEERLSSEHSSGAYDLYDEEEGGILYDVKTYGSYKTQKVLGLKKVKVPILDENGKQRKYRNGRLMFNTYWEIGRRERSELAYQLNDYRMKLEANGKPVKAIIAEIITRDAGTHSARDRGIFTNAQLVKINKISDRWIGRYFAKKSNDLIHAVETDTMPPVCKPKERWGGKRIKNPDGTYTHTPGMKCERFCPVWMHCELGIMAKNQAKSEDGGDDRAA